MVNVNPAPVSNDIFVMYVHVLDIIIIEILSFNNLVDIPSGS